MSIQRRPVPAGMGEPAFVRVDFPGGKQKGDPDATHRSSRVSCTRCWRSREALDRAHPLRPGSFPENAVGSRRLARVPKNVIAEGSLIGRVIQMPDPAPSGSVP